MTHTILPPRSEVLHVPFATHGAPDHAELRDLGLHPQDIIDFSVNSNPYGPSPQALAAIASTAIDRYPDRQCLALREVLATHHGVRMDQIVVGNGSAELIWLLSVAYVRPGEPALVLAPTFGEYARAVALMGGEVIVERAREDDAFAFRPEAVSRALTMTRPRLCFLCNPNNPTGQVLPGNVLARWADAHPHTLFVVDEAYIHFAPGMVSAISLARANVLVLRSLTKDYALAGLRLGYAVGHPQVVDAIARVRPPWNVNALALAAGQAVLADQEHLRCTLTALRRARDSFLCGLRRCGLEALPSQTHFFLVHVGDGAAFRRRLLRKGILVRDAASFGLPAYVRLATRRPEENEKLLSSLELE